MKVLSLVFIVMFLASCGSTYLVVGEKDKDLEIKHETYNDYWSALSHFEYDQALEYSKKESDQEKMELALLVKSIYHKTFNAVDTVKFAKLLSTSRNDTLKSYAKWWKEYYSNVNYAVPEFLNRFNIKHSSLFTSETSDLRDSLKIIYKETPIVRVLIQDRYINLVLDTGSPWTILRQDVFDKFNLEKIESVLIPLTNTKATKVETFNAVLPSIKFDKISLNNVPVQVTNNDGFNSTLEAYKDSTFEVSGILGWDVIKRFNFKLDYKNRYLILDQKHKARLENREVLGDSRPFIPITFEDGLQKIVYIDTGANFTELNKYFLDGKNHDFNIMTRNYDSLSGIVQDTVKLVECDFYIGDYEFSFSSLMISDRGHPVTKYSGIIGNDIFILGGFELDWESGYFRNYLYLD